MLGAYDAWTLGEFTGEFIRVFVGQPTGGTTPEGEREITFWEIRGRLVSSGTSTLSVLLDGAEVGTLTVTRG